MDPNDNMLSIGQRKPKGKKKAGGKKKQSELVQDLFGGLVEQPKKSGLGMIDSDEDFDEDDDEIDPNDQDQSLQMADNLARGYFDGGNPQEKSYTLTMVCDPEDAGIDQRFAEYK